MKLIFAGTPEFAAVALRAIINAGHEVVLVLTQPDRPSGRGMKLRYSAVKEVALAAGIEVFQPQTLREHDAQERLRSFAADAMIVAAYGLILPQAVLDMPRWGCLNIHASLLPRWRGAAPIHRAILAGDGTTGVCIMQMEAGLDTGPVLLAESLPIVSDDTTGALHDKLAELGAQMIVKALHQLPLKPNPQPGTDACYAVKIEKSEAALDWRLPAAQLDRQIRAFNPFPGAFADLDGFAIKIWRADQMTICGTPGQIVSIDTDGIVVACGEGSLRLTELQKPGGKRLPVAQFLAGNPIAEGSRFTVTAD
jgi:methionyl-tRNA formyltransferase